MCLRYVDATHNTSISNVFHLQTDRDGIHETGHWGFCDKGEGTCPMPEIDKLLTEVGKSQFIGKHRYALVHLIRSWLVWSGQKLSVQKQ